MKIVKYTYVDVYYNEDEQAQANKEQKRLEKLGYELQVRDAGGVHDFCDQYLIDSLTIHKQ